MKKERRSYYRGLQATFSPAQYKQWNEQLAPRLRDAIRAVREGAYVAAYQARAKEASLESLFALPYKFCFPKVLSTDGRMEFRHVPQPAPEEFTVGHFGILEPKDKHVVVDKREISACFVPLLCFDAEGRRLGQGKGFYDRFLTGFPGKKIGVAFEWQLSPEPLPIERHDVHLDLIVTEHEIRRFQDG